MLFNNRRPVAGHDIKTDFKAKSPKTKDRKVQGKPKGMIVKERASRPEGSFGKEKEHCHLKKVKAKTRQTGTPLDFLRHPHGQLPGNRWANGKVAAR